MVAAGAQQGLRIYVAGDSRVWHRVSSASGGEGAPNTLYYSARNNGSSVLERTRRWAGS